MKIKKEIYKRYCDICKNNISTKNDYSCIVCDKKDLCGNCRIHLIKRDNEKSSKYIYRNKSKGFICIDCLKKLLNGDKNGNR